MKNYAKSLHEIFKQHMFWIFVRIASEIGQNVYLEYLWVRFSKCYDTQVSFTGPSWPSCFFLPENIFQIKSPYTTYLKSPISILGMSCHAI